MTRQEWKAEYGMWRALFEMPPIPTGSKQWISVFGFKWDMFKKNAPNSMYYAYNNRHDTDIHRNPADYKHIPRVATVLNMQMSREACERHRLENKG